MAAKKPRETSRRKLTQTEKAYDAIKDAIVRGRIAEGEFLVESDITRSFGIGRTPYREACNRLHHEGLLEVVPRRGYLVPEMSFLKVRDLFEARLVLEGAIAELAAVRASQADVEELERLAATPAPARQTTPDFDRSIRANTLFHLQLARMTQNRELVEMLTAILERTERLMYIELRSARMQSSVSVHEPVVAAIRRRDPEAARKAVLQDIRVAQSVTLGDVGQTPVTPPG